MGRLAALKSDGWMTFYANQQPKCPHCGSDFDITDNEAWFLYDENDTHDVECPSCGIEFRVSSSATWNFSTDDQDDEEEDTRPDATQTKGGSHA